MEGYGIKDAVALTDVDETKCTLKWKTTNHSTMQRGVSNHNIDHVGSGSDKLANKDSTALAGRKVRLRIYFRDATVYAIGAN